MFKNSIKAVVSSLAVFLLAIIQTVPVHAVASNGFSITPLRNEFTIEKGAAATATLSVKNLSSVKVTVRAIINDFEQISETGDIKIIIDKTKEVSASSVANFITGLENVTLEANEAKDVPITLQVPQNAISGSYYGIVRFQPIADDANAAPQDSTVSLNTSVASLLLITVPGSITQKIQLEGIKAYNKDGQVKSIFNSSPTQLGVAVKNAGNGFEKPFGKVSIKNMKGNEVYTYELNNGIPAGNVLPGTSRTFRDDIKGIKMPGRYTVRADISGQNGDVLSINGSFWYLPVWFMLSILAIILVLVAAGYITYRRISKKRKAKKD